MAASRAGKRSRDMADSPVDRGRTGRQRGTANGGLSPGLLSRRVTSTGGRQLSDQPLADASRNPSQPLQIVVPRTCDDSCTGLLKREACQVAASLLPRGLWVEGLSWQVHSALCVGARLHRDAARWPLIRCSFGVGTR